MSYNTKQKDLILNVIKNKKSSFIVKDIYEELNKKVGLTTIYRFIDELLSLGVIDKSISSNNTVYYRYLEKCSHDNHFYLKCDNCGEMIHVDCDCIKDLSKHINEKHQFFLNNNHIIINGICKKCLKEGNLC